MRDNLTELSNLVDEWCTFVNKYDSESSPKKRTKKMKFVSPSQKYDKMYRKALLINLKDEYSVNKGERLTVEPDKLIS